MQGVVSDYLDCYLPKTKWDIEEKKMIGFDGKLIIESTGHIINKR